MNPDELRTLWSQQPGTASVVRLTPEAIWRLASESTRFKRTIFWRDAREWAATILVAGGFLYMALIPEHIHWLMIVAAIIACLPMSYVALRGRKRRATQAASLTDHLRDSIAQVEEQIVLLRSVARWYLAPLALSAALFLVDGWMNAPVPHGERKLLLIPFVLGIAIVAAVFYGVWWINQRAARQHLEPRLRQLKETLAELANGSNSAAS
jgi:hypothetical protein